MSGCFALYVVVNHVSSVETSPVFETRFLDSLIEQMVKIEHAPAFASFQVTYNGRVLLSPQNAADIVEDHAAIPMTVYERSELYADRLFSHINYHLEKAQVPAAPAKRQPAARRSHILAQRQFQSY